MNNIIRVGDKASVTKVFFDEEVLAFSGLSLDENPIHLDTAYAKASAFGNKVVHGMLVASLFSGLLGMELPGKGAVYLSQSIKFLAPVYVGDEVTAVVEVLKVREDKPIVTLRTCCIDKSGKVVVDGEAVVKMI